MEGGRVRPYCRAMKAGAAPEPVRILLMGLTEGIVRSLARCLDGDPRYALTGAAPSIGVAVLLLPVARPHLALLDWAALHDSPTDAIRRLRAARPALHIACVGSEDSPYREAAAAAGANSFILRDRLGDELLAVLEGVAGRRQDVP